MNIYFKYTVGEAFTLNDQDYSGFFHVIDGVAYTGKGNDLEPKQLTPKQTFITEFYLKELNFAYDADNLPVLKYEQPTRMDILDDDKVKQMLDVLNENNLELYAYLFRPSAQNLTIQPQNTFYYGLSSTPKDVRNDDRPTGKDVYSHIDPFSYYPPLDFLDDCRPLNLFVRDDETFYYVCASDTTQYALTGSFINKMDELTMVEVEDDVELVNSFYDDQTNYLILHQNGEVLVYDYSNFYTCNIKVLIDRFDVPQETQIGFGNVYRAQLLNGVLSIYQKYTNVQVYEYVLSEYGIGDVVSFDVRSSDDAIIMVDDLNQFIVTNLDDFVNSLVITKFNLEKRYHSVVEYIKFYNLDSNIFEVRENRGGKFFIRYKYISNPNVTIPIPDSNESLYYLDDYIYSEVFEKYNLLDIKYNSNTMLSNSYNNLGIIETASEGNIYRLTHNVGRLYVTADELNNAIGLVTDSVTKIYQNSVSCEKSSLAFSLNLEIKKVLDDVLTLYRLCAAIPVYNGDQITYKEVPQFEFDLLNSKLNENESINVNTLERIFYSIFNLQQQFLD